MDKLIVTMTEQELKNMLRQSVAEGVELALSNSKQNEPEIPRIKKREAARLLSCSTSTIDNLARQGKLTRYYVGKKGVRFDREQVLQMAEKTTYYKRQTVSNHGK